MKKTTYFSLTICAMLFAVSCNKNSDKSAEKQEVATTAPDTSIAEDTRVTEETKPAIDEKFKGDYCFLKAENKDTMTVRVRFLSDDDIRGEMIWQPWQKDGAVGSLTGKLNANREMELKYDYTIEGNRQSETKIMKIEGDKLLVKQGELIDPKNNGNMVFKDASKATYKTVLAKVNCQ